MHTPTPWHIGGIFDPDTNPRVNLWGRIAHGNQSGDIVAKDIRPANAALIVKAVNSYAAMKEALDNCLGYLKAVYDPSNDNNADPMMQGIGKSIKKAQQALALAEGKEQP